MNIYDFTVKNRLGEDISLSNYKGKVLLIVNTATGCGFTPQYEGLEKLYQEYKDKGFEILDFPCDQFGHQAPGSNDEIHAFCTLNYNTSFDRFAKIDVNGENEDALFTYLKAEVPVEDVKGLKNKMTMKAISKLSNTTKEEKDIKWNFTKFLIDRNGKVVKRFSPVDEVNVIEEELKKII